MTEELTIVFFLWRRADSTPAEFEDFYNDDHQELVARTVPPPLRFERNFRREEVATGAEADSTLMTFDSFTAATFARQADFEKWGAILSNPDTAKKLDDNEAEFSDPQRRIQLFAEPVRTGDDDAVEGAETTYLLRLGRSRPGVERADFRAAHEASIADGPPLEGELRRVRYYPVPDHPLSYVRDAWPEGSKVAPDVIEHLSFSSPQAATDGLEALGHDELESETVVRVHQVMRPPTAWRAAA